MLPDGASSAPPAEPGEWGTQLPARRRRRRGTGILVALIIVLALALAAVGGIALSQVLREPADELVAVPDRMTQLVTTQLEQNADLAAQLRERTEAYRTARGSWLGEQEYLENWGEDAASPTPQLANPGGTALPGDDPDGRAFLDSIGATNVQIAFEAGSDNCGYSSAATNASANTIVWGGCYSTRYPDWVFLAWQDGAEDHIWATFVHEAMHWYQYQHYYGEMLAAQRVGIAQDDYVHQLESDASCRAVYTHGIPLSAYANSSSPCDVDGWYEGWFRDELARLGAPLDEPTAEAYEVVETSRP